MTTTTMMMVIMMITMMMTLMICNIEKMRLDSLPSDREMDNGVEDEREVDSGGGGGDDDDVDDGDGGYSSKKKSRPDTADETWSHITNGG